MPRAGVIPPAALLVGITSLGVMMALMPANRLLTLLGLRRWRLAALFIPLVGPFVFMWLVAFPGTRGTVSLAASAQKLD
jgi:hypothetical protein